MIKPEHFVFLLVDNFSHLAFSCAVEPLRIANLISEQELYSWSFIWHCQTNLTSHWLMPNFYE